MYNIIITFNSLEKYNNLKIKAQIFKKRKQQNVHSNNKKYSQM